FYRFVAGSGLRVGGRDVLFPLPEKAVYPDRTAFFAEFPGKRGVCPACRNTAASEICRTSAVTGFTYGRFYNSVRIVVGRIYVGRSGFGKSFRGDGRRCFQGTELYQYSGW